VVPLRVRDRQATEVSPELIRRAAGKVAHMAGIGTESIELYAIEYERSTGE